MKYIKTFENAIEIEKLDRKIMELLRKQHEVQSINKELFKKIIETNNKKTIQSAIDYIKSKSNTSFSPCQYLYQRLYKIDNNEIENMVVSDEQFDFSEFDSSIELSNILENEIQMYRKEKKILKDANKYNL